MNLNTMSFFQVASERMTWLSARQKVISENIANADTPNYRAREVSDFDGMVEGYRTSSLVQTDPRHIAGSHGSAGTPRAIEDESAQRAKLNGNTVDLEMQSIKAADNSDSYRLAAQLYRKGYELLSLAAGSSR